MSTHSKKDNKKQVESISTRVKNTKAEIDQLKNELQQLINTGSHTTICTPNFELKPVEIPLKKPAPAPLPKKVEVQSQQKKVNVAPDLKKVEAISPKKVRSYNVDEARDYMKKQREKRAEQLKGHINKVDNQLDIKKQKLRELQQKTRELVSRNVQIKRERSKSREPVVRIDKSNPRHVSQERKMSKSQDRQKQTGATCGREHSVDRTRAKSQENRDRGKSGFRYVSQENLSKNVISKSQDRQKHSVDRTRAESGQNERLSRSRQTRTSQKINPNFLYPPGAKLNSKSGVELEKTVFPQENLKIPLVTNKEDSNSRVDLNKAILLEDPSTKKKPLKVLEHSMITDACLKDTKETQTNKNVEFPWMQPSTSAPYPYNFINTVKRKLQFAISSPSYVDVGIQKSEETPQNDKTRSREQIKELLKSASSDMKSFASHKGPNLDMRIVENLELVPHYNNIDRQLRSHIDAVSKNLFDNDYESESDTSKNIPEISSESLSLDKLKDLKLKKLPPLAMSQSTLKTDSNDYSSDFQKESRNLSDTIKTVASEIENSNIKNTSNKISEISRLSTSINTDRRSTDNGQQSFKSLLTESQSKSQSEIIPENISLKFLGQQMSLKEPSISLNLKKNDLSLDIAKSSLKTVTVNGTDSTDNYHNQTSLENSQESIKSTRTSTGLENTDTGIKTFKSSEPLKLKEPSISLTFGKDQRKIDKSQMKNITIRPASSSTNVNEIHLKFEAEVRLLNDFNESFKQFVAVEKAFENLKNKKETNLVTKILQNVDTQTSFMTKTNSTPRDNRTSSINFSRGSEIIEEMNESINSNNNNRNVSKSSSFSTDWNLSNLNDSSFSNISTGEDARSKFSISNSENFNAKNCASLLSLNIFDQLIKDEDTRIQQLKAIIKIREQALLDRTKSELVWLEIQRKQLIETGKTEEASLLKKKQRGIILKREQERNEIKKLKQMQKEASEHRKNTLKQQRNLIKTQLSTENMLSKITVKNRRESRERRSMGPLKVVQSCSESIHSETSISLKSSGIEDVLSITSKSVRISEESELDFSSKLKELREEEVPVSNAKRTLLMREAALQKRRKAAEELLKWHRKLLEEERKISELEAAATSVIGKTEQVHKDKYKFNGKQLNQLWKNMTGSDEKKFVDEKLYVMSQIALERLCKNARQYANKNKIIGRSSDVSVVSEDVKRSSDDLNYSSVFEPESVHEIINSQEEKTKISSISELIDNFSKIGDEISNLSKKSEEIVSLKEDLEKSSQSVVEIMSPKLDSEVDEEILKEDSETSSVKEIEDEQPSVVEVVEEKIEEPPTEETKSSEEPKQNFLEEKTIDDETNIEDQTGPEKEESQQTEDIEIKSLSLEEALQSASKIEESLSILNEKLASDKKLEETEEISTVKDVESPSIKTSVDSPKEEIEIPILDLDVKSPSETSSVSEETSEKIAPDKSESSEDKKTSQSKNDISSTKLEIEEKEESPKHEDTISSVSQDKTEPSSIPTETDVKQSTVSEEKSESQKKSETDEKTPPRKSPTNQIDVKKRVSEILADASPSRSDKSPRLQDLYITAYDVMPPNSSEFPGIFEDGRQLPTDIFGSEAEELWRKQLAIEQEIKQIEQQQKEQIPYVYMREIPNKPPPPYTPPSSLSSLPLSILPYEVKEITELASYSSKVLYKAYQNNNLDKVKFSENGFKLFSKVEVTKICAEFIFNICRDIAKQHYKQFETVEEPSWLVLAKKPQLVKTKPSNAIGLEKMFVIKLKELFGFKKAQTVESAIIKWGRKKRDHVDEVLVTESQEEESQWTNFDKDELIVKNQVTNDIMKMLIDETASVFAKILSKKKFS